MLNLITFHRLANFCYRKKIPVVPKLIYFLQFFIFNSSVPPSVSIGIGTRFAYGGIGVVIHADAVIGKNCTIGQGITIGGKSKSMIIPKIGDDVYLGAGSRILGPITIGDNVIVGPNSVVVKSITSNVIVVGVPAKVIKSNIVIKDYV